jgi:class 3 adenylate cyclase
MARSQKPDLKIIEPYDISFGEIRSDENWEETVQKVAAAINVQSAEYSNQLPFIPFKGFEKLRREEKIFLFGPSGSGKSRTIIELLRSKKESYDKIFIINPSNPAGIQSCRGTISTLSQQFGKNDLVIWDNFPEGLVKRDLHSAFGAIELLNSGSVQNLYISLKPTYLEIYRDLTTGMPEIYTHEVVCDLDTMTALIKAYGTNVQKYREVFEKYISHNVNAIAKILWQKQPLSLTVVDYYKRLTSRTTDQSEPIVDSTKCHLVAQEWLPAYDYFERQFEIMKNIRGREEDVDFLYTLRFCYEAGFSRTQNSVARLQKAIFGNSSPVEPTRKMGTWVYLSGQTYGMHDSAKNAVKLSDYSKIKIISYLADHFSEIIPTGNGELHSLGLFIGKNIQFISNETGRGIVPDQIYHFMRKNAVFERAFGRGIGEIFELLDEALQMLILEHVDTQIEFGIGLAESFGDRFIDLDQAYQKRILKKMYHGMLFARYFGQSIGRLYGQLSNEFRSIVISHADRNPQFADGLGMGLGYIYSTLDTALQLQIMEKAEKNFEISRGLGFGFGLTFGFLQEEDVKKTVISIADNNSELDVGFGMGLAVSYYNLPEQLREFVLNRAEKDGEFAFGAGIYAAYFHKESCPRDLFALLDSNGEISHGLGLGFGTSYFYLSEEFQSKLETLLKNNIKLDEGFGSGIGLVLKHLPLDAQEKLLEKATSTNAFAIGLGYGLGFTWQYLGDSLRKRVVAFASSNNDFARGLGFGLGSHIDYLKPTFFDDVISFADANSEFDRGLGVGCAWAWRYNSQDSRSFVIERMKTRDEFARGVGFGLPRIMNHLPRNERERLLNGLSRDPAFSDGFGEGVAQFLWTNQDEASKHQFLKLATISPQMSKGLGIGLGFIYSYSQNELKNDPYRHLKKIDPVFSRGLGIGMGRAYLYLSEDVRLEILRMSEEDVNFALGFGEGIGTIYNYLTEPQKKLMMSYAYGDAAYSKGLGIGLGSRFTYFNDQVKQDIYAHLTHSEQLSFGLGIGFASHILYLSEPMTSKIFALAENNPLLALGLGEGCGYVFPYLSRHTKDWLSSYTRLGSFDLGFGIGIGKIRVYLDKRSFEEATSFINSSRFMKGFAIGLGSSTVSLSKDLLIETLSWTSTVQGGDASFAKNFGFGIGHIFPLFDSNRKIEFLEIMRNSEHDFLAGLGEGLGHNLPSTGSRVLEDIMQKMTGSASLTRGAARGVTESFTYLNLAEALGMLEYAQSSSEYGRVLGEGLAEKFTFLDEEKQSRIIDTIGKDSVFSREFAKRLQKNLVYLSTETREKIQELATNFSHLHILLSIEKDETRSGLVDDHYDDDHIRFAVFPLVGMSTRAKLDWNVETREISFSGEVHNYCVCFIDIIGSTKISSDLTPTQLSRYYELFLNAIALIARNFGAKIVKNAGDALICYFSDTSEPNNVSKFKNVLDCCLTMGMASITLNAKMLSEKLPPINYRISADYGQVSVARSVSSQSEDLFGSAMNICAKINSKARPNGLVIGETLFEIVKTLDEYTFTPTNEMLIGVKGEYGIYHVDQKEKRNVINPFDRRATDY